MIGRLFQIGSIIVQFAARDTVQVYYFDRYFLKENLEDRYTKYFPYDQRTTITYIIFNIIFLMSLLTYIRISFSNPGYIKSDIETPSKKLLDEKLIKVCKKCPEENRWKPPRAYHCSTCKKCVQRMDHHCVWVNNCVGIKNLKFFMQFLFFACLYAITCGLFLSFTCYYYLRYEVNEKYRFTSVQDYFEKVYLNISFGKVFCSFLICLSMYFALFTLNFLTEQFERLEDNQSQVEVAKGRFGKPMGFYSNFKKIFGNPVNVFRFFNVFLGVKGESNYLEILYTEKEIEQHKGKKYFEDKFIDTKCGQLYDEYQKYQF